MHDDRIHARMALVRDLFGLAVDEGAPVVAEPDRERERPRRAQPVSEQPPHEVGLAEVRELPARAPAAGTRHG